MDGKVDDLGGVYSIAFLFVMAMFATGNLLLKLRFDERYAFRAIRAMWSEVISKRCLVLFLCSSVNFMCILVALVLVLIAVAVSIVRDPRYFFVFLCYLLVVLGLFGLRVLLVDPPFADQTLSHVFPGVALAPVSSTLAVDSARAPTA